MNGTNTPQTFTDFLSSTTPDEGPVRTSNIERQRARPQRGQRRRKRRRTRRAS